MISRRIVAVLLTAPLLLASACGAAKRDSPNAERASKVQLPAVDATINPAPPPPSSAAPSKAPAASSAAPASSAAASPAAPAAGGTEVKSLVASQFAPAILEVKAGTEVTWVNEGGYHTVVGGQDAADPTSPIGGNIVLDVAGATAKVKFDKPGTYPYFCAPHLSVGMKGTIVVT